MTKKNHIDLLILKKQNVNKFVSLKLKKDIDRVFKEARVRHNGGITLRALKNDLKVIRLLIIPMHGYGNAVERNLLKRRVREIIRSKQNLITGFDIVIAVNKSEVNASFNDLSKKIDNLLMYSNLTIRGN